MKTESDKLVSIQVLRGIAATMIVWWHSVENLVTRESTYRVAKESLTIPHEIYGHLAFGVPIFFAISGFIMVATTWEMFGRKAASVTFIKRRILRIFPTYLIFLFSMQLFLLLHYHFGTGIVPDWEKFFFSCFLVPTKPSYAGYTLGQAWTLTFEIIFYALFAVSMLLHRIWGLALSGILCLVLPTIFDSLIPFINNLIGHCYLSDILLPFIANNYFYYFIIGMLVAVFFKRKILFSLISVVSLLFVILIYNNTLQYNQFFFCFYILACSILCEPVFTKLRLLKKIGDCSYTLYLAHNLVILVCFRVFFVKTELIGILNYDLSATLMAILTIPISYFLYVNIEKRIHLTMRGHPQIFNQ